jgi:hypothetical protein
MIIVFNDVLINLFLDAAINAKKEAVVAGKPVLIFHKDVEGVK